MIDHTGSEPQEVSEQLPEPVNDKIDHGIMQIHLEEYTGPLDLLLDLIRKQEIDIYDIPIAKITKQFLEFVHRDINRLDTDMAGEFLLMAATLIHIKSKMLLPPDPLASTDEDDDPRATLVNQLLEHEKFKNAAQMLHQRQTVQSAMWSYPALSGFAEPEEEKGLAVSLVDLVQAFQQMLDRAKERPLMAIEGEHVSVGEMMKLMCQLLSKGPQPYALKEMFLHVQSREALIASFLALLELVRLQAVIVRQHELFGEIVIYKHKMFDVVFSAPAESEVDREYQ